jgi:hypothetical protein
MLSVNNLTNFQFHCYRAVRVRVARRFILIPKIPTLIYVFWRALILKMLVYFLTIYNIYGRLVYFMANVLFCGHLVYFSPFW